MLLSGARIQCDRRLRLWVQSRSLAAQHSTPTSTHPSFFFSSCLQSFTHSIRHSSASHHRDIRYHLIGSGSCAMDSSRLPRLPAGTRDTGIAGQAPGGDRTRTCVALDSQMVERSHSNRIPGGRRRDRRRRRGSSASTDSSDEDSCCCCPSCCTRNCNTQICCSYFMALLSSGLVVAGVYLSIVMWDRLWLTVSLFGLMLVFVGACLYCCGTRALSRKYSCRSRSQEFDDAFDDETMADERNRPRNKRKRRNRTEDSDETTGDRRINAARSLSQLSLNMIPQYFAPSDTGSTAPGQLLASSRTNTLVTTASAAAQPPSVPFSQIFSLNGQSFLILPIANESLDANRQRNSTSSEQSIPLNSLLVKVPTSEDSSLSTDANHRLVFPPLFTIHR